MIVVMLEELFRLPGRERHLAAGEFLFHRGDPVAEMALVVAGEVRLVRHQDGGRPVILQRAAAGAVLAEASLFSETYHCDAIAVIDSHVRLIDRRAMRRRFASDSDFAARWVSHLAGEIKAARTRTEILALRTIGERLDAWLIWHGGLPEKGNWKQLAEEIGASPEALYRELAKRKQKDQGAVSA